MQLLSQMFFKLAQKLIPLPSQNQLNNKAKQKTPFESSLDFR
jgi:hypothetical protein